ncbi:MAG: alpha/beta hydrolase [Deltaproteobacteria bacterium]|nr:alpha/beta hydrolase [Deltaproteobacteria bacterium]
MTSSIAGHTVVVVPGFIQGSKSVDASSRSLLRALRENDLDVLVARLPGRGAPEGAIGFHFSDYVELLDEEVHRATQRSEHVSIVGHSLGGLLAVCLPQETQEKLHRRVVVGSPLAPSATTMLAPLLDATLQPIAKVLHHLDVPFPGKLFGKMFHILRRGMNRKGVRFPLQVWAPGAFEHEDWQEILHEGFVSDSFGVLSDLLDLNISSGRRAGHLEVAPRISFPDAPPTLVIAGDADAIAPVAQVRRLFERIGSREKRFVVVGMKSCGVPFGHIDLLIGRFAPQFVWPELLRFLQPKTQ